jgi:osmoprotectant transport system ATP-binding protein
MDEPFGAVDPLNRETLQDEFASIQRQLKKTVVFVTHDLDEAVRLADEIVLMREGKVIQIAAPEDILEHPANDFAQDFVGSDRVLKRLARFNVSTYVQDAQPVGAGDDESRRPYVTPQQSQPVRPTWRVDSDGRLVGMSLAGSSELFHPPEPFWVPENGNLREALSLLLYLHTTHLAVVNQYRRLVGEISLEAIHSVTRRGAGLAHDDEEARGGNESGDRDGGDDRDEGASQERGDR